MDRWVGSCEVTKHLINLDLIKIIQFYLKIYDLWRQVCGWMGGLMGGISSNH